MSFHITSRTSNGPEKSLLQDGARSRFPYFDECVIGEKRLTPREVISIMGEFLTLERQERIKTAVDGRTCNVVPVLENIYDRGNISAVLRSAEAMGYQCAHVIETGEKFKNSNRVSQGADKWIDVTRWKSTSDCIRKLKEQNFQILATHLDERAKPIAEMDFSRPTALVLGNEKDGISQEMIAAADHTVIIPMLGFVQSFNISVAAAIALYHIYRERLAVLGRQGDLSAEEKDILRAEFSLRSSKNPERLIIEQLQRLIL